MTDSKTLIHLRVIQEPCTSYQPPAGCEGSCVKPSQLAQAFVNYFASRPQEEVVCVAMDGAYRVIGYSTIARGTVDGVRLALRDVFAFLVCANASKYILLHGHPVSSYHTPSEPDVDLTEKALAAGEIMGIPLADAIVTSPRGYFSFVEQEYKHPGTTPFAGKELELVYGLA